MHDAVHARAFASELAVLIGLGVDEARLDCLGHALLVGVVHVPKRQDRDPVALRAVLQARVAAHGVVVAVGVGVAVPEHRQVGRPLCQAAVRAGGRGVGLEIDAVRDVALAVLKAQAACDVRSLAARLLVCLLNLLLRGEGEDVAPALPACNREGRRAHKLAVDIERRRVVALGKDALHVFVVHVVECAALGRDGVLRPAPGFAAVHRDVGLPYVERVGGVVLDDEAIRGILAAADACQVDARAHLAQRALRCLVKDGDAGTCREVLHGGRVGCLRREAQ